VRPAVPVTIALAALVLAAVGQGSTTSRPTRTQLALMPLPQGAYGPGAGKLGLDAKSGWHSNDESALDDLDPTLTASKLDRIGRIVGFEVEFNDLADVNSSGHLVDVNSEVALFRSSTGAARYAAQQATQFRRFDGRRLPDGLVADRVSFFPVPGVARARGIHARLRKGGVTVWMTDVEFDRGPLAGRVEVTRTDNRDTRAETRRRAAALASRIDGVLAGTIHDRPLVP
jgi:hypothetical protein